MIIELVGIAVLVGIADWWEQRKRRKQGEKEGWI